MNETEFTKSEVTMKMILIAAIGVLSGLVFTNLAQAARVSATYRVPVPANLKAAANFDIKNISVQKDAITFEMPEELSLSRQPLRLKLVSENGPRKVFQANEASALCDQLQTGMSCAMTYNKAYFNPSQAPALTQVIEAKFGKDSAMAAARVAVMRSFGQGPVGILQIRYY